MKRLALPIIGLVSSCGLSAFIALVSFGVVAGLAVAFAPEASFKLVAPLACPQGTRQDVTLQALGYVTALSYLACFVPLCIPPGVWALPCRCSWHVW